MILRFLRSWLYKLNLLKTKSIKKPVISIGNLTAGGTGKTPFILYLLNQFRLKKSKLSCIYRGYKGNITTSFARVDGVNIEKYGDEACLVAQKFPEYNVYVSPKRIDAALEIEKTDSQLVLLDDAFQHLAMFRDLDIVILDSTQSFFHYLSLPLGNGREAWKALNRAQYVVLSKWNLASEKWQNKYMQKLENFKHLKILKFHYLVESLEDFNGKKVPWDSNKIFCLCSGIGNPKSFEQLIRTEFSITDQKIKHFIFTDHFSYGDENIGKFTGAMQTYDRVLITEKDAIKWRKLPKDLKDKTLIVKLKYELQGNIDEILQMAAT